MAASCTFPKNPLLISMIIRGDDPEYKSVELKFYGYTKEYDRVEVKAAYALFHSKTPAACFVEHIKGKYNNQIKPQKNENNN